MTRFGRLLTAMATPFDPQTGALDLQQAKRLASALLDSGTEGLVVSGSRVRDLERVRFKRLPSKSRIF